MKILMINDYLRFGGAEVVMYNLTCSLISRGHEVYVNVRNNNDADFVKPFMVFQEGSFFPTRILNHQVFQLFRFDPIAYRHYLKFIKKVEPDIIHCHNISSFGTAPILAARALEVPCVFTTHDYWVASANKNLVDRKGDICLKADSWNCIYKSSSLWTALGETNRFFAPFIRKNICQRIDDFSSAKIVAISEFQKSILLSSFSNKQVEVIPNGIDTDELNTVPTNPTAKRIIYLGGNARNKGIKDYKKLASLVNREKHTVNFVATGQFSRAHPKPSSILFTGMVKRSTLLSLLKSSICLVAPSLWPEPSSLAVLEAMGLGVPVVAYNVGAIPEIIEHDVNGFLVNMGDYRTLAKYVNLLINDKKKREALAVRAFKTIHNRYNLTRMVKQYEKLYTKMCHC
jgi:glycosyltransferase involved in cell wall biosynthesis